MRKVYVLDTNVLLHDPRAIFKFEDNEVVLPIYVIEEVDKFKRDMNELGRNARMIARFIDELREKPRTTCRAACRCPAAAGCASPCPTDVLAETQRPQRPTTRSSQSALVERDTHRELPTIFVTMDTNLRIRADALGLRAENYEGGRIDERDALQRLPARCARGRARRQLGKRKPVPIADIGELPPELHPNACVVLATIGEPEAHRARALRCTRGRLVPLRVPREGVWGVARATPSRASRSICCSTTRCSSSRWSAGPAPARRCWRVAAGLQQGA